MVYLWTFIYFILHKSNVLPNGKICNTGRESGMFSNSLQKYLPFVIKFFSRGLFHETDKVQWSVSLYSNMPVRGQSLQEAHYEKLGNAKKTSAI